MQQPYFATLVSGLNSYRWDNAQNTHFFQNTGFTESINMADKKKQRKLNFYEK